jgi:hypothetical protein
MKPTASRSRNSLMRKALFCEPPVKRPNYFIGQILSADDFAAEQEYHRGKQRRHNLHCHGFGVVQGLKVATVKENAGWAVVIGPGVAIDRTGNEIQLCTAMKFPLPETLTSIQVGIRFSERLCGSVPVAGAPPGEPDTMPARVEEGCEVILEPLLSADVLPLVRVIRRRRSWQLDRRFKVARAH